jgi:hypothetical protein
VAYFYSTPHTRSDLFPQFTFSLNVGINLTGGRTQCLLTDVDDVAVSLLKTVSLIAGKYFPSSHQISLNESNFQVSSLPPNLIMVASNTNCSPVPKVFRVPSCLPL